ncbi:MAG: hypothetical protein CL927_20000 [Deltaproteobacteria bacterium]|nr:hypothetical protein [Deltaproteobacteria bacterium]HCH62122.1 hypothetical protein [Deltaproteobacteria bacterium]
MASGFGLRERLKRRVKSTLDKLSGEHSDAAPDAREDYSRPGQPNEEAEVVMARLNRPGAAKSRKS